MRKVPLLLEPNFFFIHQYLRIKITLSVINSPQMCFDIWRGIYLSSCQNFAPTCSAHQPHAPLPPPPPPLSAHAVLSARPNGCSLRAETHQTRFSHGRRFNNVSANVGAEHH